jgi:hypothetical protein
MPTNNYQVTWDETNKKWTCMEDGAAAYDLVENSTVETEQWNNIAAPALSAAGKSKLYMDSTSKFLQLSENGGAYGDLQPLTTKGDLAVFSTKRTRLAVGANGKILEADSGQATGVKWGNKFSSPLTTKGDLFCYGAADTREALDADYRRLVPLASQATGLTWVNPPWCDVYRSGSFTANNMTGYNITWNGETSDAWAMANGTIYLTAPIEGLYHIEASFDIQQLTGANPDGSVRIRPVPSSGSQSISEWGWRYESYAYPHACFLVRLPAGGSVYIQIYQDSNISRTVCGSTTWSRCRMRWIGPYN